MLSKYAVYALDRRKLVKLQIKENLNQRQYDYECDLLAKIILYASAN